MADQLITLDAGDPQQVENARQLPVIIRGPDIANQLLIFTGTAKVSFEMDSPSFQTARVEINLRKTLRSPSDFKQSATFVSLAAIDNDTRQDMGTQVLDAITQVVQDDDGQGELRLITNIAVKQDAVIERIVYQANVVTRIPANSSDQPSFGP
jgi:hypothetical protein